jgi:hypothetical protein
MHIPVMYEYTIHAYLHTYKYAHFHTLYLETYMAMQCHRQTRAHTTWQQLVIECTYMLTRMITLLTLDELLGLTSLTESLSPCGCDACQKM